MKFKNLTLICLFFFYTSCFVKSIQPFYIQSAEHYSNTLIGNWNDTKKGQWNITSFKSVWEKENKPNSKLSSEDKKIYKTYKNGYYITHTKKENKATFLGMPFKVDQHLFIDISPLEFESNDLNDLANKHLIQTHTTALVLINKDNTITLKWLSEKAIKELIENKKLNLDYEKVGLQEDLLLTSSSKKLFKFLKHFMKSDIKNKWNNQDTYTLKPISTKP